MRSPSASLLPDALALLLAIYRAPCDRGPALCVPGRAAPPWIALRHPRDATDQSLVVSRNESPAKGNRPLTPSDLDRLTPGTTYLVCIKGCPRRARRIFKWTERRFGDIPCAVFTTQVRHGVTGAWNPLTHTLSLTGPALPTHEYSVPHYDLESCTPAHVRS